MGQISITNRPNKTWRPTS